ncbi:cytochrome c, class I [Thioalkalivibrio nitratireducens DSM 14787]|uniref:Cytochrome C n=2 Tax=Thioalkalivibrio TaxID=106633 RepID=W0DN12_9GAMM|nr:MULTISPECIES: c-type cytochrome [Thioalkalivibrio]AGA33207.1 cytochrome c, class I [Thioalkalivibrio nitratireducens DSM 14787]AHE98378.1 cytochrome C [Thioalkalivibrio paradoxus ARh 1]
MKPLLMSIVTGVILTAGMTAAQAADVEAGQAKYMACQGCHGPQGQGQAMFPPVAGKDAEYLADVMKKYRAGEQVGPNSMMMMPHMVNLSDEDIANLAAYMASL